MEAILETFANQLFGEGHGPVEVFMDPTLECKGKHADLFRDFGLEAYSFIYYMEQIEEDDSYWDMSTPLNPDYQDPLDEEVDEGPDEPDSYGEEYYGDGASSQAARDFARFVQYVDLGNYERRAAAFSNPDRATSPITSPTH